LLKSGRRKIPPDHAVNPIRGRSRPPVGRVDLSGTQVPIVTDSEAIADRAWFDKHPDRRYRIRDNWVIRRRGFLRAPLPAQHCRVDTEPNAETAWWQAAYPFLSPLVREQMAKAARQRDRMPIRKPSQKQKGNRWAQAP